MQSQINNFLTLQEDIDVDKELLIWYEMSWNALLLSEWLHYIISYSWFSEQKHVHMFSVNFVSQQIQFLIFLS